MLRPAYCSKCQVKKVFVQTLHDWHKCSTCWTGMSLCIPANPDRRGHWERFWSNVLVTPFCWPWTAVCKSKQGPRFSMGNRSIKVARVAFYLASGRWPNGVVFRACGNLDCVKPDHLYDISQADLARTLIKTGRAKAFRSKRVGICKRRHLKAEWVIKPNGQRYCRLCANMMNRKRYARRAE